MELASYALWADGVQKKDASLQQITICSTLLCSLTGRGHMGEAF